MIFQRRYRLLLLLLFVIMTITTILNEHLFELNIKHQENQFSLINNETCSIWFK